MSAPKCQQRAGNAPASRMIRHVMLAIESCGGSILLADRMHVGRVAKCVNIGRSHVPKHRRGRAPPTKRSVDDGFVRRHKDTLRKRFRLSEQRPRPIAKRKPRIGSVPRRPRWHDVEDGKPVDMARMVESHAISDAATAV